MVGFLAAGALYFGLIGSVDFLEYKLDHKVCDQTQRTARCYNWFEQYLPKNTKIDYSEGIFGEDFGLSLEEATRRKYEYIYDKLGLQPGMRVLDAGCGTGVWMDFLRQRGVDVVGLTLSSDQASEVAKKGLAVHVLDYRITNPNFIGQFDRITALGSSEHVCSSRAALKGEVAAQRCNEQRIATWRLFHDYLVPGGKVYITSLTINDRVPWRLKDWLHAYLLERTYGGYYSTMTDIAEKVVPASGFAMTDLQDKTRDYHWSSVVNKDHFGHWSINWRKHTLHKITYLLKGLMTDLHLLHRWSYYILDTWMWQFGGYQVTPLSDSQVAKAPVQLKYFMLEKKMGDL